MIRTSPNTVQFETPAEIDAYHVFGDLLDRGMGIIEARSLVDQVIPGLSQEFLDFLL